MKEKIYKIRDSVDLFITDNTLLTAYYMSSRQRKEFYIDDGVIHLLEMIDGKITDGEISQQMLELYDIDPLSTEKTLLMLQYNRIITEVKDLSNFISDVDRVRYDRQINYFSEFLEGEREAVLAQSKLMGTKILIFGCGAIGGTIATELAMAGVQEFTLFDYDIVEESDVARHMYFKKADIGKPKVESLKSYIKEVDSRIKISIINGSLRPESEIVDLIKNHDFIVNTLDEPYIGYTAAKISRICVENNIPHFIGGGFDAHLASTGELIIPYVTPCVECYAMHFKESLKGWKPEKHPIKKRVNNIGGIASMSLFSSSYACIEIIKAITGLVDINADYKIRGELLFNDLSLTYLNVEKDDNCPICGERGTR